MDQKKSKSSIMLDGILRENPVLVLLLGTCPTLAISKSVMGSLSMGAAVIVVLVCSNILISLLKNIIPEKVRIPSYIVIIAGFVSIVQMIVQAFFPTVYDTLGIYLPLIVVNCIILGRAEMFASKNSVVNSALDGLSMGIGFTLAIFIISSIRELLGSGTWLGMTVFPEGISPMLIFVSATGGFFVYGVVIAAVNYITKGRSKTDKDCSTCGACAAGKEGK